MPDSFANYMKKEVMKYIKKEVDKGIPIKQVRGALLEGGHRHDLIEEAILDLLKHNFDLKKASAEPVKSETLAQEMYAEVLGSLIDYVEFQKKQGYSTKEIKEILLEYGHSGEILDNAIKAVEKPGHADAHFKNIRFIASLFVFIVFLLWVSASSGGNISNVLIGFFPAIGSLILTGIMVNRLPYKQKIFLWLLPFVLTAVFIIISQSGTYKIFEGMEVYNLAVLNIVISIIFSLIIISSERTEEEPEPMSDLVKKEMKKGMAKPREEKKEEPKQPPRPRIREIRAA